MSRILRIRCPDCGSELTVDEKTGAVIDHHRPQRSRADVDIGRANELLRREESERENKFRDSISAEKNRSEILRRKFEEGLKRAEKQPGEPPPTRDIDLD
jgi:Zn-finger nucleic acid-binding protein